MSVEVLQIGQDGEGVTIGFHNERFIGEKVLPSLKDRLQTVQEELQPKMLRFDLTGVEMITSDVLGLLVALHTKGLGIVLLNPSTYVREVVEVTKLDGLLKMVDGER
jgi:anti-sigma B factor antagonist